MSVGCHFCTCLKLNKRFVSGWAVWLMMLNGVRCPWPSTHFIRAITVLSTELSPVPIPLTGGVCSLWVRQGAALLSGGECRRNDIWKLLKLPCKGTIEQTSEVSLCLLVFWNVLRETPRQSVRSIPNFATSPKIINL